MVICQAAEKFLTKKKRTIGERINPNREDEKNTKKCKKIMSKNDQSQP